MNIGLDMMGGDQAPLEAVKGAVLYLNEKNSSVNLSLIGDKAQIDRLLADHQAPLERVQVIHAEQVIDMHDSPTRALKDKPRSSITIGFHLLATGKIDAFISAANTGAMLVGALLC